MKLFLKKQLTNNFVHGSILVTKQKGGQGYEKTGGEELMVKVYLNNGTVYTFKKGKPLFENGKLFINFNPTLNHNFDYQKELKEVYKVEECTCKNEKRLIYRGYLLKRGVEVQTTAECSINGTGETEWTYY